MLIELRGTEFIQRINLFPGLGRLNRGLALIGFQTTWARLQNYHFTLQYKKGKELFVADTLSHAALNDGPGMTQEYNVFRVDLTQMDLSPNLVKPSTMNHIREENVKDPSLMTLKKVVLGGWSSQKHEVLDEIIAYWDFRDEISVSECSSNLIKS